MKFIVLERKHKKENKNQLIKWVTGKSLKGFISRENDDLEEKNERPICEVNELDERPTLIYLKSKRALSYYFLVILSVIHGAVCRQLICS